MVFREGLELTPSRHKSRKRRQIFRYFRLLFSVFLPLVWGQLSPVHADNAQPAQPVVDNTNYTYPGIKNKTQGAIIDLSGKDTSFVYILTSPDFAFSSWHKGFSYSLFYESNSLPSVVFMIHYKNELWRARFNRSNCFYSSYFRRVGDC